MAAILALSVILAIPTIPRPVHLTWDHDGANAGDGATKHWTAIALDGIGYVMTAQPESAVGAVVAVIPAMTVVSTHQDSYNSLGKGTIPGSRLRIQVNDVFFHDQHIRGLL